MVHIIPRTLLKAAKYNFQPVKPQQERLKKTFEILYDKEGKYLLMHHRGASYYYKMNGAFLVLFAGATAYNYVQNS
jgi:hypothetical protein